MNRFVFIISGFLTLAGMYAGAEGSQHQHGNRHADHGQSVEEGLRGKLVTPVVGTASLTVLSNVTGDKVYIDDQFEGSTRLDLDLPKGRYTIRIEKGGYESYEETIILTENLIIKGNLAKASGEFVQTVSAEIVFWQSIQESDDPDMFEVYLDEYPSGKFAKIAKLRIKKLGGDTVIDSSIPKLNYGRYHALVIGNNRYQHLSNLRTAVNDATKVASVLKRDYGFEVGLLTNATESEIVKSLRNFRRKLTENDNLLIYYAGHGGFDEDANRTGYWLPVDASRDDPSNWIMTDYVVNQITAMEAKHVMVVADSCFSGAIGRGIKIDYGSPNWVHNLIKKKARIRLTSGGLEPVVDGGGSHSVFAKIFISLLEENTEVLNTSKLFNELQRRFPIISQNPQYGDLHEAGDDGGDFLFVRQ